MNVFRKRNLEFIEILDSWLSTKKNIKIKTFQKYERLIERYLKNTLGLVKIKDINQKIIIEFLERKARSFDICAKNIIIYYKIFIKVGRRAKNV